MKGRIQTESRVKSPFLFPDRAFHPRSSAASVRYNDAIPQEVPAVLTLAKYSVGVGDRFAHQAKAQLRTCQLAAERGVEVVPVWNKSNREHVIIGSEPQSVRAAADAAVKELGWTKPYHVDADHIRLDTVDRFLAASDFFTIDVADSIGQPADPAAVKAFAEKHAGMH